MIRAIGHRGPDGPRVAVHGRVGLAAARLSIIDIEHGWQPIANEDGTVRVVANGEIFNYVELRRELMRRGHRLRTQSDVEVIVHLYEDHGDDFVRHLNGQFAIVVHDARRQRLVLARDRVGIRPLFHTIVGGRFAAASEIKALFTCPEVPRAFDVRALGEIFTFWSPLEPRTAFAGVSQVPPGHVLTLDLAAAAPVPEVHRYWDWSFAGATDDSRRDADWAAELRDLLDDAVRLQLRADVPVAAYLSGGLDSAIIATILRRQSSGPPRTFSLTFDDAEFDEERHQLAMAAHLGSNHTSVRVGRADIASGFPRTIWQTESPIVRTAPTPMMLLSGHVHAAGAKVVLTGEGADEVFGGYDIFKEAKARRFMARVPGSRFRPKILRRLYPYLEQSPSASGALTHGFFSEGLDQAAEPWFAHIPRMRVTQRIWQFLRPEIRDQLEVWDPRASLRATLPPDIDSWAPMGRDQYVEAHTLMSGYLLSSQGDCVAMANAVEGRFPFLDHRVIEFACRLPPRLKLRALTEKYLLKQAYANDLPTSVVHRTKQPFRAPDAASFFTDGVATGYAADLFGAARLDAAGLFDPRAAGKLFEKCRAGRAIGFGDNMAFIGILSTMLLHDQFVRPAVFRADRPVP